MPKQPLVSHKTSARRSDSPDRSGTFSGVADRSCMNSRSCRTQSSTAIIAEILRSSATPPRRIVSSDCHRLCLIQPRAVCRVLVYRRSRSPILAVAYHPRTPAIVRNYAAERSNRSSISHIFQPCAAQRWFGAGRHARVCGCYTSLDSKGHTSGLQKVALACQHMRESWVQASSMSYGAMLIPHMFGTR